MEDIFERIKMGEYRRIKIELSKHYKQILRQAQDDKKITKVLFEVISNKRGDQKSPPL